MQLLQPPGSIGRAERSGGIIMTRERQLAACGLVGAAVALGIAIASERWGGMVPCALCLLERWPCRVAIVLGAVALVLPRGPARLVLVLLALSFLADAALAFIHVGVEQGFWPSPLPECAAPRAISGSIAQRLAAMPAHPAKPCDDPTYLIPGLPVSMAAMNLMFALGMTALIAVGLGRGRTVR